MGLVAGKSRVFFILPTKAQTRQPVYIRGSRRRKTLKTFHASLASILHDVLLFPLLMQQEKNTTRASTLHDDVCVEGPSVLT